MKGIVKLITAVFFLLLTACDHNRIRPDSDHDYDNVVIFYAAGYFPGQNDLSNSIRTNINEIKQGYLPTRKSRDVVILLTHLTDDDDAYMVRMYRDRKGLVCDTLATYPQYKPFARAENFKEYLTEVKDRFDAGHYGLILSSHGSGWAPEGYFLNPSKYESGNVLFSPGPAQFPRGTNPYSGTNRYNPDMLTKSMFVESGVERGVSVTYEMDIDVLKESLPVHLDYLIFDACYMGCVEVLSELKDVADRIVSSQTEIVGSGLDYVNMMSRLIEQPSPDLKGLCQDFYDKYDAYRDGDWRKTCLVSLVDCGGLDRLASVAGELNARYAESLAGVAPHQVQYYFCSPDIPLFYDLLDIYREAGISDSDMALLSAAVDDCVECKFTTNFILNNIRVERFSGLSMYLPCGGTRYLSNYYKTLTWNGEVGLVK